MLSRIAFFTLLKNAIWRRGHKIPVPKLNGSSSQTSTDQLTQPSVTLPPPAECVYALMGFFDCRIMPDVLETEMQALARLSVANDSDRLAERMISMLPKTILDTCCWYSD